MDSAEEAPSHKGGDESPSSASQQETSLANAENASSSDSTLNEKPTGSHSNNHGDGSLDAAGKCDTQNPSAESGARTECSVEDSVKRTESSKQSATRTEAENASEPVQDPGGCTEKIDSITSDKASDERSESERPKMRCIDNESPRAQDPVIALDNCTPDLPPDLKEVTGGTGCDDIDTSGTTQAVSKDKESEDNTNTDKVVNEEENMDLHKCIEEKMGSLPNDECNSAQASVRTETDAGSNKCLTEENCINEDEEVDNQEYGGTSYSSKNPENSISDKSSDHSRSSPSTDCIQPETSHNVNLGEPEISSKSEGERAAISRNAECDGANGSDKADGDSPGGRGKGDRDEPDISGKVDSEKVDCDGPGDSERADRDGPGDSEKAGRYGLGDSEKADRDRPDGSGKADSEGPDGSGKADSEGPDGSGKADSEGPDGSGKADCDVINGSGKVDHHGTKRGGNPERESHGNSVMAECEGLENSPNVDCAEPEGGVEQLYAPVTQMTAHSDRGDFSMVTVDDPSFETAKVTEEGNGKANASKSVLESSETVVSREEAMEVDSGEDDVPSVNKDQVPYPEGGIEDDTTDANSRGSINADTSDAVGISKDSNNQESELMDTSEPHIEETGIPSSCEEEKEDSKSPAAEDTCRKDHPSTHSEPDDSSPSSRESDSLDCRSKDIAETRQPETKPSVDKTVEEVLVVEEETTNPRKEASAADGVDLNSACEDELVDSASSREENDLFQLNRDTEGQMDVDESQQDEAGTEMATEDQEKHVSKEVDKQEDSNEIGESTGEDKEGESNDAEGNNKHKEDKVGEKVVSSKLILGVSEGETIIADETGGNEVEEDLCIVPDTEPRIPTDKEKAEAVEKAGKTATECSPESSKGTGEEVCVPVESVTAKRRASIEKSKPSETVAPASTQEGITRTPEPMRRPQRQAAQKADAQIKVCLAAVDSQKDDEDVVVQEGEKEDHTCCNCGAKPCRYRVNFKDCAYYLCKEECVNIFKKKQSNSGRVSPPTTSVVKARELDRSFVRKCGQCNSEINANDDKVLTWETMDFCNEDCLGKHQTDLGSHCANCKGSVQAPSLGKYCVRFGYDIKQFCCASCLEEFKKGLKVCSYCQKDISNGVEGFLAPVGDKGQFKDFCTQACMEKYEQMSNNTAPPETANECAVCNNVKVVKVEVVVDSKVQQLCSEPCFAAFKFVNAIVADQCDMCKKYFDKAKTDNFTVFYDDAPHSFCCKTCMNVYILAKRKIVPCVWCKVKKYNFDMIKKVTSTAQVLMMCSLNCLTLYHVSVNCATNRRMKCDKCNLTLPAQYHLTMSDATIRNFCSYNCVMNFQGQYTKCPITLPGHEQGPHPTGGPKKALPRRSLPVAEKDLGGKGTSMPVISSVTSLAPANGQPTSTTNSGTQVITAAAVKRGRPRKGLQGSSQQGVSQPQSDMSSQDQNNDFGNQTVSTENIKSLIKQQLIIKPPQPPPRQNRAVQVKPIMHTKGVSCRPHPCTKETQTEEDAGKPVLIPIPVPIFIPAPMHMYSSPYPVPIPFPLPIPVPIFIPTTRNSAKGIFKEIKRIQEKIPTDPFEAELLMMAEMVAGEKKAENTDTESEDGDVVADEAGPVASSEEPDFTPEAVDTSNTFGDDIMQMALKMASELDEPAVDFEAAVVPATITQTTPAPQIDQNDESEVDDPEPNDGRPKTGRKRPLRSTTRPPSVVPKRSRRVSGSDAMNVVPSESAPTRIEPTEKPDANMCLKFTFGVNAWKHWVSQKNAELEKAASNTRKLKLFKPEILQLTADELNYSLCLFVKEVRKPNGSEYAPDTIYYLCLGIQQYLIENGRVENIFSDPYYEKFTECLDDVAKKFSVLYNDAQYVVTRVEEEHLWESKQLGAHSPHVLLSTLMFFNTKHFNLTTVDEHMQLSFSHIMKHWKRNPNSPGAPKLPGSRNVLLRFYPPQSSLAANARKKKVYEQQENEDNPLRCPVKLYEFYLSKCPESVKTRNDVFYLLPERSCVPDSPVWYSTMALGKEQLQKMLHRIKMVKEINIALLSS